MRNNVAVVRSQVVIITISHNNNIINLVWSRKWTSIDYSYLCSPLIITFHALMTLLLKSFANWENHSCCICVGLWNWSFHLDLIEHILHISFIHLKIYTDNLIFITSPINRFQLYLWKGHQQLLYQHITSLYLITNIWVR